MTISQAQVGCRLKHAGAFRGVITPLALLLLLVIQGANTAAQSLTDTAAASSSSSVSASASPSTSPSRTRSTLSLSVGTASGSQSSTLSKRVTPSSVLPITATLSHSSTFSVTHSSVLPITDTLSHSSTLSATHSNVLPITATLSHSSTLSATQSKRRTTSASASATASASISESRSHHAIPPWLIKVDNDAPSLLPRMVVVSPTAPGRFSITTTGAFDTVVPPGLTIRPFEFNLSQPSWAQQCLSGFPSIPHDILPTSDSGAATSEFTVTFAEITTSLNASVSVGTTYLLCTSDGYFSGVVVALLPAAISSNVTYADGSTMPADRSISLPATQGQFAPWAVNLSVSWNVVLPTGTTSQIMSSSSAALYATPSSSSCAAHHSVATFEVFMMELATTSFVVTIRSSDLGLITNTSVTSVQLCMLGSAVLNTTFVLWRGVSLNGAQLAASSPLRLLVAAGSLVSLLQLSATSANIDSTNDAVVLCDTVSAVANQSMLSLTALGGSSPALQSFMLEVSSSAPAVEMGLCMHTPSVATLRGKLVVAVIVVVRVTAVDGVAATSSPPAPLTLFVGATGATVVEALWSFPDAWTSSSFSEMVEDLEMFIGVRDSLNATVVSPINSTLSRGTLSAATSSTTSALWTIPAASWGALIDFPTSLTDTSQMVPCWRTASSRTTVSVEVALLQFDATLLRADNIGPGNGAISARTVVLMGSTNTSLLLSYGVLGPRPPGVDSAGYYLGSVASSSSACSLLSSSAVPLGPAGTMTGVNASTLSSRLVFSVAGGTEGLFCLTRAGQTSFARHGAFTVVTVTSIGNISNVPQLMQVPAGHTAADRLVAAREFPIACSNLLSEADMSQIVIFPCTTSNQALVATTLEWTSQNAARVTASWQDASDPAASPNKMALCWRSSSVSDDAPTLSFVIHILPHVSATPAESLLLAASPSAQLFPVILSAAASLQESSLMWAFAVASSSYDCSSSASMPLLTTSGFTTNTTNTTILVSVLTSGVAYAPRATVCMGAVTNSIVRGASTYVRLPFQATVLILAEYALTDHVSAALRLFPTTSPAAPNLYLYDYASSTIGVALIMDNNSVVTSSSNVAGLTLSLALSPTSACASASWIASWVQGGSFSNAAVSVSTSEVLSDNFFLCAKVTTQANMYNSYGWTKFYMQVVRISSLESSLSPASYATSAEVLAAAPTSLVSIGTLAASSRTITAQGQNLDSTSALKLLFFLSAGEDCSLTPDLVAPSSETVASRTVFTIPAVSTPLDYQTVCIAATIEASTVLVYLNAKLRIMPFATIGLPVSSVSGRQQGIVAVTGFVLNLTIYGPGGSAVDPSTFQLLASNASSCGRGSEVAEIYASFTSLPITQSGGVASVALSGLSIPGTYYLCYADASEVFSSHRTWAPMAASIATPVGITVSAIDLKLSGYALGTNSSVGSLVNSTLSIPATGSLLSSAAVYISATDTSCSSTLTGSTAFGNSRVPVAFSGCSGSASSATLPAASAITGATPMTICLAIASSLDSAITSVSSYSFFDSGLRLAVVQPDALYVVANQTTSVSYLGTLSAQPIVGMLDGDSGVALSVIPTATVLQAEWISVSPIDQATGEVYTLTSNEGDTSFDFSSAAAPVQLRTGKFGFEYVLKFSVPTSSSSTTTFTSINSSSSSLGSCTSSLQWAVWYTATCTTCPDNAYCDGSTTFRVAGSYWRHSALSPNLYSCGSPYMEDTCISNTTTGTCVTGHTGPRCSVCEPGYGLGSGYCSECAGNEVTNGIIVFFAALAVLIVIVVLVISTLQCKKSDQFPIYFKLLINHLTQASTLGEFSQYLTSALVTLFKIQRQVSRPSPAFAALTCTFGISWYEQFIMVVTFPGAAALALIVFFGAKQLIAEAREREALAQSRKDGAHPKDMKRKRTVMFFAPKHKTAAESLEIDGVEHTSSIGVLDISNDASLFRQTPDGRPPLIRRRQKKNQEECPSSDVLAEEKPRESPPSAPLGPLDPPADDGEMPDEQGARPQRETPTAFALDDEANISGTNAQHRNNSSRSTGGATGVSVNVSVKDIRMAVSVQDEKSGIQNDDDEDELEGLQEGGLQRRDTAASELGLLEVHRSIATAKARHLFMVVMIIVMFAAYPSILEWCANLLRCDSIDIGEAQTNGVIAENVVEYFYYDRSRICTSDEHQRYTNAGIALGCIYGFGTPICAVLLYMRLRRPKRHGGVGFVDASRMFTFLIAGYRKEVWWWEAVVMFRKMLLIYISAFLTDAQQQTLCAFWAICFYLMAHEIVRPYEYDTVDRMERYSLVVICLTLNFSMAYSWLDARDTPGRLFGYWAISIFLLVINICVVAWMLYQIVLEGTLKVRKFLYLNSSKIKEKLPPRLSECILQLAYRPPEMVEIMPDGQMVEVDPQDMNVSAEEHQAFLDAEDSGSDWSDDEDFSLDDDNAVEHLAVTVHGGDEEENLPGAPPHYNGDVSGQQLPKTNQPQHHAGAPGAIVSESSIFPASPSGGIIGSIRNRLKSMGSIFGLRKGVFPSGRSHPADAGHAGGAGLRNNSVLTTSVSPMLATQAAQDALSQLESAYTSRSHNTIAQLRAIIDGMQTHSDNLINKYATIKQTLQTRTQELAECKKHCEHRIDDGEIREHVGRLSELEAMAQELREENESLKDQLQMAQTTYERSASPTNQRLVNTLRREREELLKRLAEQDMAFGASENSAPGDPKGSTAAGTMEQRLRELAIKAEEEEAAAKALAEAERQDQMKLIEAQLNAKRQARLRRAEGTEEAAPPPNSARRKTVISTLVDKITSATDEEEPPNPFRTTLSPRESLSVSESPASRIGVLAGRLESAMRDALHRANTRPTDFFGGDTYESNAVGLSAAFPDENFSATQPDEQGRVLVIKRRHPKMRPPEFLAPWGHATWADDKKKKKKR